MTRVRYFCRMDGQRYKLVVADIDGTLMGRQGHITDRVRRTIREAVAAGIIFTLATGRWFRSAQPIALELDMNVPIVLHNGALIKESVTGTVLDHCHFDRRSAMRAIERICAHGLQPIIYESAFFGELISTGPVEMDSEFTSRYLATKTGFVRRVTFDRYMLEQDPLQIAVADVATRADALIADLANGPWQTVTSMSLAVPEARFVEILNPVCSKGRALAHLATHFGVQMHEVLAIGDNFNDLEMIETAGLGIAMGNAPDAVKSRSDWIAPSVDEDGLAVAIEQFVLQRKSNRETDQLWTKSTIRHLGES